MYGKLAYHHRLLRIMQHTKNIHTGRSNIKTLQKNMKQ